SVEAVSSHQAAGRPEISSSASPGQERTQAQPIRASPEPLLKIPPLPTRFDLDGEMREAFLADASDLFERIEASVVRLSIQDNPRGAIDELGRCLHTLKGAAGSVGLNQLTTLIHEVEERLGQTGGDISPGLNDVLHQVVGYLDE